MKFFLENHSGDVNIDSGPGQFFHPFQSGIHIHIASESVFTSLRNDYSHAPESALSCLSESSSAMRSTATNWMRIPTMRMGRSDAM
jgi:hypothetical protein